MKQKILSVVVPTYNMEAYLPRCLDSVTRKDVPDTLEVIIVNDGSKDRSLEIAKEYQAKRPDIISIIDKPNGHYGSCINAALKVATGKYFRPLDADDWFDTDALIEFLKKLSSIDTDLVISGYLCYRQTEQIKFQMSKGNFNQEYSLNENSIIRELNQQFVSMHAFTYKLNILRDSNLKLSEGINYTDCEYVIYPLSKANTMIVLDLILYQYDLTREGQSMDIVVAAKNHSQLATIIKRFYKDLDFSNITELAKKALLTTITNYIYRMLFYCKDDRELKEIDSIITSQHPNLIKSINKLLKYALCVWRIFGIHFFWYEPLKIKLGINR